MKNLEISQEAFAGIVGWVRGHKVLALLLFFFALRVSVGLLAGQADPNVGDGQSYNSYARAILNNPDWLTNPGFPGSARAPVYPVFLAFIYLIFGTNNVAVVYVIQAVLSTLVLYFIFKLALKIFNDKVALIALVWAGFYYFYLKYVGFVLRETLEFFLMAAAFYYLFLFLTGGGRRVRNFGFTAVSFFLLSHTNPKYLLLLPLLLVLFLLYQPVWPGLKKYLLFLTVYLLLMVPWVIRNYIAYNGPVIISSRLDFRGSEGLVKSSDFLTSSSFTNTVSQSVHQNVITRQERELIKQGFNPRNRSAAEVDAVMRGVYPAAGFWERRLAMLIEFWRVTKFKGNFLPYPSARFEQWSLRHNLLNILCYGILIPFFLLAVYLLARERHKYLLYLLFPIVFQAILHTFIWSRERYRNPIDMFIIIIGVYGLYSALLLVKNFLKKRRWGI
jgi:hypothetical protein